MPSELIKICAKYLTETVSATTSEFDPVDWVFLLFFEPRRYNKTFKIHTKDKGDLKPRAFS